MYMYTTHHIQVFAELDIVDLIRCGSVCRSWKVLTQSNALWSKVRLTVLYNPRINRM